VKDPRGSHCCCTLTWTGNDQLLLLWLPLLLWLLLLLCAGHKAGLQQVQQPPPANCLGLQTSTTQNWTQSIVGFIASWFVVGCCYL
jgi:hypothetical protein